MTAPTAPAAPATTADLRAQMAQTRTELSGTIDGIQERLNPERLISRAKEALTGGQAAHAALGAVRRLPRKPIPIALIAAAVAGVGYFVRTRAKRKHRRPILAYSAPAGRKSSSLMKAVGTGFAIWSALNRGGAFRAATPYR